MVGKIFKIFTLCVLVVIVMGIISGAMANNPSAVLKNLIQKGAVEGLDLKYRICLFGFIPVGNALFADEGLVDFEGQTVHHLWARAQTFKLLSPLGEATARIDSYMDKDRLCPLVFTESLVINNEKKVDKKVAYDLERLVMRRGQEERTILPDTKDPLSAILTIRKMDLAVNKDFELNINTNQKNYLLKGRVIRYTSLVINGKKYGVWQVDASIRRRDKSPRHSSFISIWLLGVPSRTPLLIKVSAGGGNITARLVRVGDFEG